MDHKHAVFKTGRNELTKVLINEIIYFKADGDYTHIKTYTGETLTICKNLKNTLADVDSDLFVRINRSVVVNHLFITRVKTGTEPLVQLNHSVVFRPSKKYQNDLKQIFVHTMNRASHTVKGGVSHIYSGRSHNKQKPEEM
ncbi:MAG: hypothetical protein IEMM0006_1906 [bacterium]|nr:MAG: hypothetical protein IEMM0006_1906 [bacterium]